MGRPQTFYPGDLDEMVAWVASSTPAGARVLEIGCGDGDVVRRLRAAGVDATGVDPHADPGPGLQAVALEDLHAPPFDVLFASVSLHHVHDASATAAALRRLSRPGTLLLVREFDRVLMDHEPNLRWWFHQRHALAAVGIREDDHDFPTDFAAFAAGWRAKMEEHVLPWSAVAAVLADAGFTIDSLASSPYLFRWGLHELLRPLEEALIASRHLRAVGLRCVARREG